ncbi:uncharacterized protein LOC111596209 [Drosophila hydei]|uniref:Uncharacterized protein LOC111596209 n=1 Tax=Drosophila hydei TaxID=7224 RepID=A0A6J1LG93_DROHY|nr:uncharacterized protein LOC111596209 [Drosophila hydei]
MKLSPERSSYRLFEIVVFISINILVFFWPTTTQHFLICKMSSRWARWQQWVDVNARPKNMHVAPSIRQPPTRWQKPGPMDRQQWINFHRWAERNARPAPPQKAPKPKPMPTQRQLTQEHLQPHSPLLYMYIASKMHANRHRQEESHDFIANLSQPKVRRKKHVNPPKREYPYRPQLCNRAPPRPEPGRPVEKPKVPCCFQHEILKINFWSNIDFKISTNALKAKASKKIVELAKPRTYPRKLHCPLPEKPIDRILKRKMSAKQWRDHQMRLKALSQPNARILDELSSRYNYYKQFGILS